MSFHYNKWITLSYARIWGCLNLAYDVTCNTCLRYFLLPSIYTIASTHRTRRKKILIFNSIFTTTYFCDTIYSPPKTFVAWKIGRCQFKWFMAFAACWGLSFVGTKQDIWCWGDSLGRLNEIQQFVTYDSNRKVKKNKRSLKKVSSHFEFVCHNAEFCLSWRF